MRVMIIEDEFVVAAALEMVITAMGHDIAGRAATVEAALSALEAAKLPDVAIVDLNLRGQSSEPVAVELHRRKVPFLFATGYDVDGDLRRRFPAAIWLRKPYAEPQIKAALAEMARRDA